MLNLFNLVMDFHFRVYRKEREVLVAACDSEVYGHSFEEGKMALEVNRDFYGGELAEWDHLHLLLKEATVLNLVGEDLISRAIDAGFIGAGNVLRVKGVPHAQMVTL